MEYSVNIPTFRIFAILGWVISPVLAANLIFGGMPKDAK